MNPGYERAARRLSELSADDRDWILAQLPEADRLRISELIEREDGERSSELRESAEPAQTRETTVERASAANVAKALRDEPDWLVALVLATRRWPWDSDYLCGIEPARLERLREIAGAARETAKPRACNEAVAALAAKLERLPATPEPRTAFDDVLEGMMAWRGQAPEVRNET
jgi:hypothetical protein